MYLISGKKTVHNQQDAKIDKTKMESLLLCFT